MNKKILLVDADSTIPNIALAKISTYHKRKDDLVEYKKLNISYYPSRKNIIHKIDTSEYDKVYCSAIFSGSLNYINFNSKRKVVLGGTGFDLKTTLPPYMEAQEVDYSYFKNNRFSYGYLTRGCVRNCYFCVVPKKEGLIHQVAKVDDIVRHKQVKFLDNNILAFRGHLDILQELIDKNLRCQFFQGLDIRLLNSENTNLLLQLNYIGEFIFALDEFRLIPTVDKKITKHLGWAKDWELKFYVYINPKKPLSDTVKRIEYLRSNKILPYLMRDKSCWVSEYNNFYTDIVSWTNQVHLFKTLSFAKFLDKRTTNTKRIKTSVTLYQQARKGLI